MPTKSAHVGGSISEAGVGVNKVVFQNDLLWKKTDVKCRVYRKEELPEKTESAQLRWPEMEKYAHEGWNKMQNVKAGECKGVKREFSWQ